MMSRRLFGCLVVTGLAVATLLVTADPASAQRGRRGGIGFGYSPATGLNFGYGNGYYGDGYYGGGYNPWGYSYGRGYYPGYSGYGWNSAYGWNSPGYGWSDWNTPTYYSETYPSYNTQGMQGSYYDSSMRAGAGAGDQSYGAMSNSAMDNHVLIGVRVPSNAEVWFDDQKTSQTGSTRSFISPPLQGDKNFVYHIRARWSEDGRQVEKERKLEVHPGDRLFVNFIKPRAEGTGGTSSGQYGSELENRGSDRSLEHRDRTLDDTQRNRQENADRALDNRNQPRSPVSDSPRTGNDQGRQQTPPSRPQGDTSRPPQ